MFNERPYVLTIAGFDPSAGAGVLADVKTFEQCDVYGMGVVSALTYQNDEVFKKVDWVEFSNILNQIEILQNRFKFDYIKIGLIENLEILNRLILILKSYNQYSKIIWDPILNASSGFVFHENVNKKIVENTCKQLYLITPNVPEAFQLGEFKDAKKNAEYLSQFFNVYLKGGHNEEQIGYDILFTTDKKKFEFSIKEKNVFSKHGSGCVLSSAITANLAKDLKLELACAEAKNYITNFLMSNDSLLGYHSNIKAVEHG